MSGYGIESGSYGNSSKSPKSKFSISKLLVIVAILLVATYLVINWLSPAEVTGVVIDSKPVPVTVSSIEDLTIETYSNCTVSYYSPEQGNDTSAVGGVLYPEYSCAVNPSIIPFGSTVFVNGIGYKADDTGLFTLDDNRVIIGICSNEIRETTVETIVVIKGE